MNKYLFHPLMTQYCSFQGRACRKEFWSIALFLFVAALLFEYIFFKMTGGQVSGLGQLFNGAVHITLIIPLVSAGVRRLHDTNRSGWWTLITFIPVLGTFIYLFMMFLKGTDGENRFGPPPHSPDENELKEYNHYHQTG